MGGGWGWQLFPTEFGKLCVPLKKSWLRPCQDYVRFDCNGGFEGVPFIILTQRSSCLKTESCISSAGLSFAFSWFINSPEIAGMLST